MDLFCLPLICMKLGCCTSNFGKVVGSSPSNFVEYEVEKQSEEE